MLMCWRTCPCSVANARVECPQGGQGVSQSCGRAFDLNFAAPGSKFAQRPRNVKGDRHDHPFFVARDLWVGSEGCDLRVDNGCEREGVEGVGLDNAGCDPPEASSNTALRTQTTRDSNQTRPGERWWIATGYWMPLLTNG